MPDHKIAAQIAEVEREIALRKNVYPGFVSRGKMRQAEADLHIAQMASVLETLRWCRDNEQDIREIMGRRKPAYTVGDKDNGGE